MKLWRSALALLVCQAACSADLPDPKKVFNNGILDPANRGLVGFTPFQAVDEADGAHLDTLFATIDTTFRTTNALVSFATSSSVFSTGSVSTSSPPDTLGIARAFLKAPADSSVAYVTASVAGVTMTSVVKFMPALPQWVSASASPAIVVAAIGASADITLNLQRSRGSTTAGGLARFEVIRRSSPSIAAKLNIDSTVVTGQSATSKLFFQTADPGTVVVRATYRRGATLMSDTVVVQIVQKPT